VAEAALQDAVTPTLVYPGRGRPTQLTQLLADRIAEGVYDGCHPEVAARSEGIARSTFQRWMAQGEADDNAGICSIYGYMWAVIDQKDAACERNLIREAASGKQGWQGPMTVASRKYRDRWEDKQLAQAGFMVQIGIKDSDVSLSLSPPSIAGVERKSLESLAIQPGSDNRSYVNQD
jgi:hypothetical protein